MRPCLLVLLAGCGAQVSGGNELALIDASPDPSIDAAIVIDAPPIDTPPPPCVEGDARMETPSGCFAAFTATPKTRVDARATCAAAGMHLAYVRSAADQAVIAALSAGQDVAIGLDDLTLEGTFVWEDGSALTYTDWADGEPNNANGQYQEDCAIYVGVARPGGQWDDRPCAPPPAASGVYGFICQR